MNIDKPTMEPKIPEPLLGVSREILGDPGSGDGGGGGERAWTEEQRGETRRNTARGQLGAWKEDRRGQSRRNFERRQMRVEARSTEGRTGHARYAAEEPKVWRRNPRYGTWRCSGGVSQPGPVSLAQGGLWRPWVAQEETEDPIQIVVSITDPSISNHPVYYTSTDIRERPQKGK